MQDPNALSQLMQGFMGPGGSAGDGSTAPQSEGDEQ